MPNSSFIEIVELVSLIDNGFAIENNCEFGKFTINNFLQQNKRTSITRFLPLMELWRLRYVSLNTWRKTAHIFRFRWNQKWSHRGYRSNLNFVKSSLFHFKSIEEIYLIYPKSMMLVLDLWFSYFLVVKEKALNSYNFCKAKKIFL